MVKRKDQQGEAVICSPPPSPSCLLCGWMGVAISSRDERHAPSGLSWTHNLMVSSVSSAAKHLEWDSTGFTVPKTPPHVRANDGETGLCSSLLPQLSQMNTHKLELIAKVRTRSQTSLSVLRVTHTVVGFTAHAEFYKSACACLELTEYFCAKQKVAL